MDGRRRISARFSTALGKSITVKTGKCSVLSPSAVFYNFPQDRVAAGQAAVGLGEPQRRAEPFHWADKHLSCLLDTCLGRGVIRSHRGTQRGLWHRLAAVPASHSRSPGSTPVPPSAAPMPLQCSPCLPCSLSPHPCKNQVYKSQPEDILPGLGAPRHGVAKGAGTAYGSPGFTHISALPLLPQGSVSHSPPGRQKQSP